MLSRNFPVQLSIGARRLWRQNGGGGRHGRSCLRAMFELNAIPRTLVWDAFLAFFLWWDMFLRAVCSVTFFRVFLLYNRCCLAAQF